MSADRSRQRPASALTTDAIDSAAGADAVVDSSSAVVGLFWGASVAACWRPLTGGFTRGLRINSRIVEKKPSEGLQAAGACASATEAAEGGVAAAGGGGGAGLASLVLGVVALTTNVGRCSCSSSSSEIAGAAARGARPLRQNLAYFSNSGWNTPSPSALRSKCSTTAGGKKSSLVSCLDGPPAASILVRIIKSKQDRTSFRTC
mmetsp:Transcript_81089/g.185680  ORF Transcript_81089/g.185680 Transcript_81089/m.185680 type:complete len:204 (-) Transcript_81089:150-761(-)